MLATHIVYRLITSPPPSEEEDGQEHIAEGNRAPIGSSPVTGCVLLFPVVLHWEYQGKYKHMYTSWEDNGNSGVPVFGLELAKFIWCKWQPPIHFRLFDFFWSPGFGYHIHIRCLVLTFGSPASHTLPPAALSLHLPLESSFTLPILRILAPSPLLLFGLLIHARWCSFHPPL